MFQTFRKQNLNFLEILFTDFYIINPMYKEEWDRLVAAREFIARMNEFRAVKSMKGIALEKYHAMEHRYPAKIEIIDRIPVEVQVTKYSTTPVTDENGNETIFPSPIAGLNWLGMMGWELIPYPQAYDTGLTIDEINQKLYVFNNCR